MELQNLEIEMNRVKDLENTILYMDATITALVIILGGDVEIDFNEMEQEILSKKTVSFLDPKTNAVTYRVVNREELNARTKKRKDI